MVISATKRPILVECHFVDCYVLILCMQIVLLVWEGILYVCHKVSFCVTCRLSEVKTLVYVCVSKFSHLLVVTCRICYYSICEFKNVS